MTLRKGELINLPVYTQSGEHLGKVADFVFQPDGQTIIQYHIKSGTLLRELLEKELLVSREQVISITNERMVVEDSVITIRDTKKEALKKAVPVT